MKRFFIAAALAWHVGAFAQSLPALGVPMALQVERLAPQLVPFAGSQANFQNLVNGLATGSPVTLVTVGTDGSQQIVTFTPNVGPMSATDIARTLESARQQLIANGIASPSAQQLGAVLLGGLLPTPLGGTNVTGLLPGGSPAALLQNTLTPLTAPNAAVGGTSTSTAPGARNMSDTPLPRNTSDSTVPGNTSDSPPLGPLPQVTPAPVTPPAAVAPAVARTAPPIPGAAAPAGTGTGTAGGSAPAAAVAPSIRR
jgi:hypothetical protein